MDAPLLSRSHTFHTQVVKSLKETGQYENTIIVVTTDNGGAVKVGGNNMPLKGTKGTNDPCLGCESEPPCSRNSV